MSSVENTMPIQKITPFLWFDHQAEEAAAFYTSIFRDFSLNTTTISRDPTRL